jgi:hypothetical protein
METLFAHSYILIFGKLAVGGAIALAVPDSALLERGYYKSTAAVFIGCVMCMAGGQLYLLLNYPGQGIPSPLEVSAWCFFCTVFVIYFITLFTDSFAQGFSRCCFCPACWLYLRVPGSLPRRTVAR